MQSWIIYYFQVMLPTARDPTACGDQSQWGCPVLWDFQWSGLSRYVESSPRYKLYLSLILIFFSIMVWIKGNNKRLAINSTWFLSIMKIGRQAGPQRRDRWSWRHKWEGNIIKLKNKSSLKLFWRVSPQSRMNDISDFPQPHSKLPAVLWLLNLSYWWQVKLSSLVSR